jgi:hypothetical protein
MGERRTALHADESGTEFRVEDRWASVRRDDPREPLPRRGERWSGDPGRGQQQERSQQRERSQPWDRGPQWGGDGQDWERSQEWDRTGSDTDWESGGRLGEYSAIEGAPRRSRHSRD